MGILFKLNANFKAKEVKNAVNASGVRGLKIVGEYLLEESKKTVPYRDGMLESSGAVSTDGKTVCRRASADGTACQPAPLLFREASGREK